MGYIIKYVRETLYKMKRIATLILSLTLASATGWAQSGMTDSQVMDYVIEQNAKGVSHQQIVTQLMQRGVDIDQIRRIQQQYQKLQKDGSSGGGTTSGSQSDKNRKREANGEEKEEQFIEINKATDSSPNNKNEERGTGRKIFGHDVFNKKNLSFESSMNLATPQNYCLGPGDVVNIDIWGASQESISKTITPDGTITVNGVGVISLGGLSVKQAKSRLRSVLGPRYQDSQIELTLGQTRTITVSIMGEVKTPGTYTMSAFATVYNALYMAGGPNDIGTLRNVQVFRNGRLLSSVDVYDFLLNGKLTGDVRLQDNDIITVAPYEALVNITGKVKRPMFYEMKKTESAATLLRYAGGFTGDAYTKAIRVNRKAGEQYSVFSVGEFDLNDFKLMDEDSVSVDANLHRYQNMVEIKGAVFRPGMYQLGGQICTVKALIEAADGLMENAISNHAVMHRMQADRSLKIQSIDIKGILEGTVPDVELKNEDVIYIASREEVIQKQTITIHGEVNNPGVYKFASNGTIEDLVIQAGGLTKAASLAKVDVARRIIDPDATQAGDTLAFTYSFKLNPDFTIPQGETPFILQPYDHVYIRRSPNYIEQQNIAVEGEVQFEGTYTLTSNEQHLSDMIKLAGGITKNAYPEGGKLIRRMTPEELETMKTMLETAQRNSGKDTIDISKLLTLTTYPVAIELEKALQNPHSEDDPILREGDHIIVPKHTSTVTINGEVLYPNTVRYMAGKNTDYYIDLAGGTTSAAKKSKTIIVYMNGMVAKASSKNKPRPGCQIVVPTKKERRQLSTPEILSMGSSIASLGSIIASIVHLTK